MRVLLITETATTGVGLHVADLASGLAGRGHDIHLVWSPRRADERFLAFVDRAESEGIAPTALPLARHPQPRDLPAAARVRRMRREGRFDIVHGHSSKGGALARLARIGARRGAVARPAVVYTPNALVTANPGLGRGARLAYGLAERMLARLTDVAIAVSVEERDELLAVGMPADRIVVVPNGCRPLDPADRALARARLGLGPDDVAVGFVGRLDDQKCPLDLVRAFAAAAPAEPRARLVLIGDGPHRAELHQRIEAAGLADRAQLVGAIDARPVIPAFDVLAMPSRYEGHPYVALEALSVGLPVVAFAVGGLASTIEPDETGLLVAPGDTQAFAAALARAIGDGGLRRRAAVQGPERFASRFSVERMVEATEAAYEVAISSVPDSKRFA